MKKSIILHLSGDSVECDQGSQILLIVDNIENVQRSYNEDIVGASIVLTRDGKKYFVKESMEEIHEIINS